MRKIMLVSFALLVSGCLGSALPIDDDVAPIAADMMPPWACRTPDASCGGLGERCRNADAGVPHCNPGLRCDVYMRATQQHKETCVAE